MRRIIDNRRRQTYEKGRIGHRLVPRHRPRSRGGSSRGDGYAVCINYYERKDKADELVALLRAEGCEAIAVQADVSKRSEVNAMVRAVRARLGKITLLVNNAGVAGQALFQDVTDEMWERYFGVNLNGARNTIQAVLPNMLHEKSGCIVNISSIWGQHGASCEVTYSCTKHALIGLTRSLAMELAPSGIRVNCVAPGVIETDMVKVLGEETLKDLARANAARPPRQAPRTSPRRSRISRLTRRRSSRARCSRWTGRSCSESAPCAAKAPLAAHGLGQGVNLLKFHRQKRQQHELGDAVTVAHGALFVAVVVQGDEGIRRGSHCR